MPYRLPLPLIPSPLYPARLPEGILHCHLNGSFEALCTHHQPDVANIFGKLSIGSNGIQNKPENQDEDVLWERSDKCLRLFINVWNISIWKYVRKYVRFCRSYKASDPWQMLFSDQNVGGLSPSQGVGPFSGGYCHCHLTEKYHLGTWLCTLR